MLLERQLRPEAYGRRRGATSIVAAAAAEVARFAAFMAWDQHDRQQARALYGQAVRYAERSGSDAVTAYMQGSWALWAAETGQGAEALRLARQVPTAQPIRPWLAAMRATVASSVGDPDATLAALRDADHALQAEQTSLHPAGIYPLTPAKLQGYVGRCYVRLRLHKAAVPALQEALDGMPRSKQRAILLLDLARALGDGDEARELTAQARRIGEELQSPKVLAIAA
jgi:tetratricopeptide (TPR) repeat protein